MKILRLVGIFVVFVFYLLAPFPTFAADFSVTSNATYTVSENGNTHAVFNFKMINTTSKQYASSYKINIGFDHIENVRASDSFGTLQTKVDKSSGKTIVEVVFNKKVVGINKESQFTLSFDTPDAAVIKGNIKEIDIPGISAPSDLKQFDVSVVVPSSFDQPLYVKPQVSNRSATRYNFTLDDLKKSGISIGFGQRQTYSFTLKYNLKNTNFFPILSTIALPPSTNYQDVYFDSIDPKPSQVIKDADGNWLAQYQLSPTQTKSVIVKGFIETSLYPKREPLSDEAAKKYLVSQKYWDSDAAEIKKLAQSLKTPEAIYAYVVKTLKYDFSRISSNKPRLGALTVLSNTNSAVCLEFTDLFIAIARAAGIPAREVDGYASTQNSLERPLSMVQDILHTWPEYYDKSLETWVMVDPTWGNTTGGVDYFNVLDFNHVAFVIKGINSEYPIPAGAYKFSGNEKEKDIDVTFTQQEPQAQFDSKAEIDFPKESLAGFPVEGYLIFRNSGNTVLPPQKIEVIANKLQPGVQQLSSPEIPPFGYARIPVSFNKTSILTKTEDILTIRVGNKQTSHEILVSPFVINKQSGTIGGLVVGVLTIIIYFVATRSRRISIS